VLSSANAVRLFQYICVYCAIVINIIEQFDKWLSLHIYIWRHPTRLFAGFPPLRSGVRDRVCHVGFCGGQSGSGVGFLRVFRFPLPIFIPPIAPQSSSSIIGVCTIGQVAAVPRTNRYLGTQCRPTNNK
jgi:hypothetical protein